MDTQEHRITLAQDVSLCAADGAITLGTRTFIPDATVAYADVHFSHAVPAFNWYGEGLSPAAIQRGHATVWNKPVSLEHALHENMAQRQAGQPVTAPDKTVGHVAAVEFLWSATGELPASPVEAPGIRAVLALYKGAAGMTRVLGEHQSGKHRYTVSMEVWYARSDSGFLVRRPGLAPGTTPEAWARQGWSYVPHPVAERELLATRDWKRNRMAGRTRDGLRCCGWWRDAETYWLMGGLEGPVFYAGLGWVRQGAEGASGVDTVVAGVNREDAEDRDASAVLGALGEILQAAKNA